MPKKPEDLNSLTDEDEDTGMAASYSGDSVIHDEPEGEWESWKEDR
jgi:hypothetical protein